MGSPPPIPMLWGEDLAFRPLPRFLGLAQAHYGLGEVVDLAPFEPRSEVSHRHEFAWLRSAWLTLPEDHAEAFASPEALRKSALIDTGYFDQQIIDVGTNAGAHRVAQAIRAFPGESYSRVVCRGPLIVLRRARSQSQRMMGAKDFQASKTAILEHVAGMLGVAAEDLKKAHDA